MTHRAKKKITVYGFGVVTLTGVVLASLTRGSAPEPETAAEVVSVGAESVHVLAVARIQTGPIISGSLQPERQSTVRAEVGGVMLATSVDVGRTVPAGTVLGRIDDAAIRDAVESARSAVRAAEGTAEVARRNVARNETLLAEGAVAERALEDARTAALAAERGLMDARTAFAQAQKQLGKTVLRAPISGVVAQRSVNAGDVVQLGTPLFTIVDPGSMTLEASVPSEQLGSVRVGAPVEFHVNGYGDQDFIGTVERISPVADPTTRQVKLFVSVPNAAGRLVGGLYAEGRIAVAAHEGLVAPKSALDVRAVNVAAGAHVGAVLRLRGGTVEQVPVEIGLRDDRNEIVEIVKGVNAGDTLLVGAARTITPGTPLKVRR